MTMTPGEYDRLTDVLRDVNLTLNQVKDKVGRTTTTTSQVSVNAGGMAVWIATTACLVMLAVNLFLAMMVFDQKRKIDDLNDYLNAIYMMAPSLKPPAK